MDAENARLRKTNKALQQALRSLEKSTWEESAIADLNECGENGNNWGKQYKTVKAGSACGCDAACEKDPDCKAWSYIPVGLFDRFKDSYGDDCSFRRSFGGMIDNCRGKCRSGTRRECGSNGNNWGKQYKTVKAESPCGCADACQADPNCKGWTYMPVGTFDQFKDSYGDDCAFRKTFEGMIDNCNGKCTSGRRDAESEVGRGRML